MGGQWQQNTNRATKEKKINTTGDCLPVKGPLEGPYAQT